MSEAPPPSARPSLGQTVLTFLESVGRPAEAQLYLRLFRSLPRGRFATVVPTTNVLQESLGTLVEQLALLTELGLYPSIVLGATGSRVGGQGDQLVAALAAHGVQASQVAVEKTPNSNADSPARAAESLAQNDQIPILTLKDDSGASLAALTTSLRPQKVIVLRGAGGLGPHGMGSVALGPGHVLETHQSGIGVINLRSDLEALLQAGVIPNQDVRWLERVERLLEATAVEGSNSMTVSMASPFSLLRELFTMRGEGTLVKLGSVVRRVGLDDIDQARLEHLLNESFGRSVEPAFWRRRPERLYLEKDYRGVALLEPGQRATFLSKFAVLPVARGEGLGQDLWREMIKDTPALFWRARPGNAINSWYSTVCDGLHRSDTWHVFWRGVDASQVPTLVADAISRPEDFASAQAPAS